MLTSVVIMKCIRDSGFLATLYKSVPVSSTSVSWISLSHFGWVKSPVPMMFNPLILAKRAISCMCILLLVARL